MINFTSKHSFRVSSPAPRSIWNEVLKSDPSSLIYHTPAWTDAICSTGKYSDASRLYEAPDGRKWVLPLVRKKSVISEISSQGSFPGGWGLGGVISNCQLYSEDLRVIFADLAKEPVLQTLIHPNPLVSSVWETAKPEDMPAVARLSHILDLEGGFEKVWEKRFRSTTRTAIRKAENSNLTVEWDCTGKLIPVYYEMFMQWAIQRGQQRRLPPWVSRWTNSRREPLERYQNIAKALGDTCRVYVALLDGQPVACTIFLAYNEHAFYYRGTSIRELAGPVRANDLLQARMIEEACRTGCRYYHMGESGGVESLMRFKSGFGAEPVPFMTYSVERLPVTGVSNRLENLMKHVEHQLMTLTRRAS